jgi:flagellar biogenesis protein FliO
MEILKVLLSLMAVIGLIIILAYTLKIMMNKGILKFNNHPNSNIVIKEIAVIDNKNKLCVTSWNNKEYLLLIGDNNIVIDKNENIN